MRLGSPLVPLVLTPLLWAAASAAPVAAQCEPSTLAASDAATADRFGTAVALHGARLVAGAPQTASGPGAAYVFWLFPTGPAETAKLVAPTPTQGFGEAVAVDGDVLVVGAPLDDEAAPNAGAVFVFEWDGAAWTIAAKLLPPAPNLDARFGSSVALAGDVLLVGAPRDSRLAAFAGAAAVFHRAGGTWSLVREVLPPQPEGGGRFGTSVALGRELAVVGEPGGILSGGRAWVYDAAGGPPVALPVDAAAADGAFGQSVATDGRRIAVGAPAEDGEGPFALLTGRVHVFSRTPDGAWVETAELAGPPEDAGDRFGWSVALLGDHLLAGALYEDLPGAESGAAFLFRHEGAGWTLDATLAAGQPAPTQAGISAALSPLYAVTGAPLATGSDVASGLVVTKKLPGCAGSE